MASTPKKMQKKSQGKSVSHKRRRSVTPASRVASGLISHAMRMKGFAQAEIVTRWAHIVGPELAASTVPVRLVFPRGERMGAKLIIRCESAFAPLLQHKSDRIIQQVNSFFGYGAVASLDVKQGPLPQVTRKSALSKKELGNNDRKKLNELVGETELSPLQEAVKSLGEMVLSNKK